MLSRSVDNAMAFIKINSTFVYIDICHLSDIFFMIIQWFKETSLTDVSVSCVIIINIRPKRTLAIRVFTPLSDVPLEKLMLHDSLPVLE